jgi:hypothetical protein
VPYTTKLGRRARLWHHGGIIIGARAIEAFRSRRSERSGERGPSGVISTNGKGAAQMNGASR